MLEKIDLTKIFEAARQRRYDDCEIYFEQSHQTDVQLTEKRCEIASTRKHGVALRLQKDLRNSFLTTTSLSTKALLALIEGQVFSGEDEALFQEDIPNGNSDRIAGLKSLLRKPSFDEAFPWTASYKNNRRTFEIAKMNGFTGQDKEEEASFQVHYQIRSQGKTKRRQRSTASSSIDLLWNEMANIDNIIPAELNSWHNPWPAPRGEMMVHWSSCCTAKLFFHFIRAFEADLFLGRKSFLVDPSFAFQPRFSLQEKPPGTEGKLDHEGTPRQNTIFFEDTPRTLACNTLTASQLQLRSTGHARREHFLSLPTVSLWNAELCPTDPVPHLLGQVRSGLTISDLDILRYDPLSGEIEITLTDAALVHQGEAGEAIEPVTLKLNLLSLLESFRLFSSEKRTWGFHLQKEGQRILTEVTVPAALSPDFLFPGSVPLSHYW